MNLHQWKLSRKQYSLLGCDPNDMMDFLDDESSFFPWTINDGWRTFKDAVVKGTDNFRSKAEEKMI